MNSTSLLYLRTSLQLTLTKQQGRYVPAQIACVAAGPCTHSSKPEDLECLQRRQPQRVLFFELFRSENG